MKATVTATVATMNPDKTVRVRMRVEYEDGSIGDGNFVLKPGDPDYDKAKKIAEEQA